MSEIVRYCSCGSVLSISGNLDRTERLLQLWEWEHTGEEHKPCLATETHKELEPAPTLYCPKCGTRLANMHCIACGWSLHKC